MNRKQRRAKKIKNHDPVYMVKKSDMRGRIDSMIKNDPEVQKAIQEEAHRLNVLDMQRLAEDIDTVILTNLHQTFGFGKKRLLRFVSTFVKLHKFYGDRYEDSDIFAMKQYLKEKVGIDVADIEKEVERLAEEESAD